MENNKEKHIGRKHVVSVSKTQQLADILRETIDNGQYKAGDCIPSLTNMAEYYGMSVNTVREAVAALVQDGLLCKVQGRGTFVAEPKIVPKTIALVVPHLYAKRDSEYSVGYNILARYVQAIQYEAKNTGTDIILYLDHDDPEVEARNLARLMDRGIDAVIMFWLGSKSNEKSLARLVEAGIPVIMIDRYLNRVPTDYVVSNNTESAETVVKLLVEHGFRQIHYFTQDGADISPLADRLKGYKKAVSNFGLDCHIHKIAFDKVDSLVVNNQGDCVIEVAEILGSIEGDFAVFADYPWCIEVMSQFIYNNCLSGKLALASFDDWGTRIPPDILYITAMQPFEEIGAQSVDLALKRASGEYSSMQHVIVPGKIIVSDSLSLVDAVGSRDERGDRKTP
ncbi:MAG: GntR family transcriptional regulator [Armatimonadota bacterium]|nr:GntR family transcriptional regulator [bacterium]